MLNEWELALLQRDLGFGVWGLGFGVWGLAFRVWGWGFGVWGLAFGFGVWSGAAPGHQLHCRSRLAHFSAPILW